MTVVITAFERSPDGGKGLARDTRVRWALEEAGQPYEVRLVSFRAMKEPAHLALHPFGQIPTYEEGDLALFETGAIVFHIAQHHAGLLPGDANARARAITWMFAALSTVEPPILEFANARLLEGDKPWSKERLPLVADRVRNRLVQLCRPAWRCRLARWSVQRRRPDDGVGAAQAETLGHPGRIPQAGCLCRPRRSAARLQAGIRRPIGNKLRWTLNLHEETRMSRDSMKLAIAGGLLCTCLAMAASADAVHPVKISQAQVAGAIFKDYKPVVKTEDGNTTHDVEVFLSQDRQFDAGMYRSGKVRAEIKTPYGVNEYMHFLEGGVTLTSSDGTVTEVRAGDSVVIPAEWTGVWDTEGYTKIYVIYSPSGPITE